MIKDKDLKKLEKKALLTLYEDGFTDIMLGVLFLGMSFNNIFRISVSIILSYIFSFLIVSVGVIIYYLGKKYITTPRIGVVKFTAKRKAKIRKFNVVMTICVVISFIFTILILFDFIPFDLEHELDLHLIGFLLKSIPFFVLGIFLKFNRFYLYGLLYGFTEILIYIFLHFMDLNMALFYSVSLVSIIILIIGIVSLVRFFKKYPLLSEELM